MLHKLELIITSISDAIWPLFLPFILVVGAIMAFRTIFMIKNKTTNKSKLTFKNLIGPASISLGAMIGTGAIIGVLGALSKLSAQGEMFIESIAIWALIGSCIMLPVSYSETLISKIMNKTPKEYISMLITPVAGKIYAVCFVLLAVFGFGGFQFSGIDSVFTLLIKENFSIDLTLVQRYLFFVIPVILIVGALVLSKKHEVFMSAMTFMIGTAIIGYFIFFILFLINTSDYIPQFMSNMINGLLNPTTAMLGVPLGFILAIQKVIQTAETGLGALAMASQESESAPREAGLISLIPTAITVVVSIIVTSYIASYGLSVGIMQLSVDGVPTEAVLRLGSYFKTAQSVTGNFGLIVLSAFTVLSALTTILGSYYYLTKLYKSQENKNIVIYIILIIAAGTLAVFGANVVFEAVDLLLFVLCGINVVALFIFTFKKWKEYKLKA